MNGAAADKLRQTTLGKAKEAGVRIVIFWEVMRLAAPLHSE